MEPMKMRPYYRYGEMTPWGGDALRRMFGKDAPEDRAGESLEVSALEGMESVILSGEFTGMTLAAALRNHYAEIVGEENGPFPLLLKLLDARDTLSVQVHPGDDYAREHDGKLGKTEAWMVLSADPGAKIAYGLKPTDEKLSGIVARGEFEQALNFVTVAPGDVYYIPHGMVHALGGGVQVYEIQQSSDATYRFWDWGRVGKDGKPRELHTEKALDVSVPDRKLSKIEGTTVLCKGGSRTYYISEEHFELCRLNLSGKMPLESGRMLFLTPMSPCTLRWGDEALELRDGVGAVGGQLTDENIAVGVKPFTDNGEHIFRRNGDGTLFVHDKNASFRIRDEKK